MENIADDLEQRETDRQRHESLHIEAHAKESRRQEMSTAPELFHEYVRQAAFSGDLEKIVSQYADDAIVMPPNDSTLYGLEEIRDWWREYFQYFRIQSSVEREREVTPAGDQVFDRSSVSITIVPKENGAPIQDDLRSLTIWKRV